MEKCVSLMRRNQGRDTQGFDNLQIDSREAGDVAGKTRRDIEARTGNPVVTPTNYRYLTSGTKKHKRLEQGNAPGEGQKSNEKEGEI